MAGRLQDRIPFALPDVGEEEAEAVASTVRSGWVTSGPSMRAFESEFAAYLGGDVETIAVNSATAGLHLALEAVGVGPGDEVIVPDWTFTSTAEVARYLGAVPVIVDVDPDTLNIDPEAVRAAISPRTKAVVPVHFAGLPVDLKLIREVAIGDRDIALVEDAAHAFPARGTTGLVGTATHSDIAVFSFYATKTITTGEGGMMSTRDARLAARARVMRLHGIDRDAFDRYTSTRASWAYDVIAPGYKYNMPDLAAALGRVQLARADQMRARRQQVATHYLQEFAGLPVQLPQVAPSGQTHSWHLFVLRISPESGISRDEFILEMAERGIGTSVHFIPLHELTYWKPFAPDPQRTLPVSSAQGHLAVSLPLFSKMTDAQVERVVDATRAILKSRCRRA